MKWSMNTVAFCIFDCYYTFCLSHKTCCRGFESIDGYVVSLIAFVCNCTYKAFVWTCCRRTLDRIVLPPFVLVLPLTLARQRIRWWLIGSTSIVLSYRFLYFVYYRCMFFRSSASLSVSWSCQFSPKIVLFYEFVHRYCRLVLFLIMRSR